jgi:very-short-patch-repair endonuclease
VKYNPEIVTRWFAQHGLHPTPEHYFAKPRRWRFDFAFVDQKVALEVEGGVWTGGRHTRGAGFLKDMEKYNTAAMLGWRIVRCVPADLCTTDTVEMVKKMLTL